MSKGNQPTDGGNLILSADEVADITSRELGIKRFVRPFIGSRELINSIDRYCLWLAEASPEDMRSSPEIKRRLERVKEFRMSSKKEATRRKSSPPYQFDEVRQPVTRFLAVPEVSSSGREYVPIAWLQPSVIPSNKLWVVTGAGLFHFGVLSSTMHMAWVRAVSGRLKSDYQYSAGIVYNNYPWPSTTDAQKARVEECAQAVLDARAAHPDSSLADLYDPTVMPKDLRKAHDELDKAVDACYGRKSFGSERERVEMLFELYRELVEGEVVVSQTARAL